MNKAVHIHLLMDMDRQLQKRNKPNRRRPIPITLYVDDRLARRFHLLRQYGVTTTSLLLRGAEHETKDLLSRLCLDEGANDKK